MAEVKEEKTQKDQTRNRVLTLLNEELANYSDK